ncbi:hypothetical protein ACG2LH_16460 [Zhouia sp. PK063]|uniref:hypothetical protein n=1 Tax=Zhouia sp. PK063 TaxID=3373602 RepID=UPI0037A4B153
MNTIKVEIDKSEYGADDFANYRIDGFWLDEKYFNPPIGKSAKAMQICFSACYHCVL